MWVYGHEPGESRWELVQQRERRAGVVPEQQRPAGRRLQLRVPSGAEFSSLGRSSQKRNKGEMSGAAVTGAPAKRGTSGRGGGEGSEADGMFGRMVEECRDKEARD